MKRIFLTGISGMLGTNLAHELLEHGYEVTGLIRKKSSYRGKLHPALKLVEGDLFSDLSTELEGVDAVIHAAAETRQDLLHYKDYSKVNFNAGILLFLAAVQCRVKRFIYISSANTIGHGTLEQPGNETMEPRSPFTGSFYARSKAETEKYLLAQKCGTEVVILNPSFMLGGYSTARGSGRIVVMGLKKRVLFIPPGGKNFVHVADVARAARLAITAGETGERYLIAGENLSYSDFFRRLGQLSGKHPKLITLPPGLLSLAGYAGDLIRKMGFRTGLSTNNMKILCEKNYYSSERSVKALGIHYTGIDIAIQDTLAWYRQNTL